jgi:hypothetical protein
MSGEDGDSTVAYRSNFDVAWIMEQAICLELDLKPLIIE